MAHTLHKIYPWTHPTNPLIASAPMMNISLAAYALATSSAGGLGFLAGGYGVDNLKSRLSEARDLLTSPSSRAQYPNISMLEKRSSSDGVLPIGVGVQNWGADLDVFINAITAVPVVAVWFFAARNVTDLSVWAERVREVDPDIQVWVQIGSVAEALTVAEGCRPDVLVIQGRDAGGHGLARRAGIMTLLPEVKDTLARHGHTGIPLIAAGGIMEARGAAAALCLGADGVCLGTRLLASEEAVVAKGYQNEVLRASDGGTSTVGSTVYDAARGIKGWPAEYDGRGIINQSWMDAQRGMSDEENQRLYKEEMKKGDEGWGVHGRMTTYAGTGVGLVTGVKSIKEIIDEIHDAVGLLGMTLRQWSATENGR